MATDIVLKRKTHEKIYNKFGNSMIDKENRFAELIELRKTRYEVFLHLTRYRTDFFQIDIDVRAVDLFSDSVSPHRTSMEEGLGTNTIKLNSTLV